MAYIRNVHDGVQPSGQRLPAPHRGVVHRVTLAPAAPAAPAVRLADAIRKLKDAFPSGNAPSPYSTYSKGAYRIVGDGDQWRVDVWGTTSKAWSVWLRQPKSAFRLEEDPVNFYLFRINPGEDVPSDPSGPPDATVMDAAARRTRLRAQSDHARAQIEAINASNRERWANRPAGTVRA